MLRIRRYQPSDGSLGPGPEILPREDEHGVPLCDHACPRRGFGGECTVLKRIAERVCEPAVRMLHDMVDKWS